MNALKFKHYGYNWKFQKWLLAIYIVTILGQIILDIYEGTTNTAFFYFKASFLFFLLFGFFYIQKKHSEWYVKIESDTLFIRKEGLFRTDKLLISDIKSYKKIVTGDLQIIYQDKEYLVNKDFLTKEDFLTLVEYLDKVTK